MNNPFLATGVAPGNVVLDLDGVVFLGCEVIAGSAEALSALSQAGWRILFATNNGTRSIDDIAERIASQTGFAPDPDLIITSGLAAAGMLSVGDQPVYVVGERGLHTIFAHAGIAVTSDPGEAAAVVVALDREFSYDRLADASVAVRGGARFVATNTDHTFPTPTGQVPGAGALVAAVSTAAGREPEVAGKPHMPMIEAVSKRLGPGETWMVGDRPETDIAFAATAGWRSVLALSGVTERAELVPPELQPDLVVESIADLVQ
jgi:4-nitrophenyl phosphatase